LIEVDLNRIKELRQQHGKTAPQDRPDDVVYETALLSSRMLLITRGVEAHSEAVVFALFRHHFLDKGLVDANYLSLIEAARNKNYVVLRRPDNDVFTLAQSIEDLYAKMDNSLKFPGEKTEAKQDGKTSPDVIESKDFRGVLCPMNFVKTKLALESLASGNRLRVLLDDGAAIQNVPRSVAEEGHKIIEQLQTGNHWTVVIEKR